jgi:hypothetical protein
MVKVLLIILVIAILMDDSSSIRKTEEERKEEEELAKAVNATLAEEKKRQEEEDEKKRQEDEKKRTEDEAQKKRRDKDGKERAIVEKQEGQDEACPPVNNSCPIVEPCPKIKECHECPAPKDCPPVEECGPCPEVRPCKPCRPCGPCPVANTTLNRPPTADICPESTEASMSTAVAMAVGACASLLATCVAALIGIILRYVPPLVSGCLFLTIVIMVWFLSSRYPETARELGARTATLLREAATALSHRVMEAIRHRDDQVCVPIKSYLFLRLSSMFSIEKVCTRIFYVVEN